MNADLYRYFEQLNTYMKWQTEQIMRLNQQYEELRKDVEALKAQRGIHIDKIEYKFDQLKVEKLDGTPNIGISPTGGKAIEDLEIQGEQLADDSMAEPECFLRMKQRVDDYLMQECPGYIQQTQQQYGLAMPADYGDFVIDDIRNQIEPRIWHYLKTCGVLAGSVSPEQDELVFGKVKGDIQTAIDRHMQQAQTKGGTAT